MFEVSNDSLKNSLSNQVHKIEQIFIKKEKDIEDAITQINSNRRELLANRTGIKREIKQCDVDTQARNGKNLSLIKKERNIEHTRINYISEYISDFIIKEELNIDSDENRVEHTILNSQQHSLYSMKKRCIKEEKYAKYSALCSQQKYTSNIKIESEKKISNEKSCMELEMNSKHGSCVTIKEELAIEIESEEIINTVARHRKQKTLNNVQKYTSNVIIKEELDIKNETPEYIDEAKDLTTGKTDKCKTNAQPEEATTQKFSKEKGYICSVCYKYCTNNSILKKHMVVHTGARPYCCKLCDKRYSQNGSLKKHMDSAHTEKKRYICDECQKQFTQKAHLKTHMAIHCEVKAYSCDQCQKQFRYLNSLKQHRTIHTGEKLYSCDQCEKKFRHKNRLKSHMALHSGAKPYSCKKCKRQFSDGSSFKRHMFVHEGPKTYSCTYCPEEFNQSSSVKNHMIVVHSAKH